MYGFKKQQLCVYKMFYTNFLVKGNIKQNFFLNNRRWMIKTTYHSGAYGDDKSRKGYGHLFFKKKKSYLKYIQNMIVFLMIKTSDNGLTKVWHKHVVSTEKSHKRLSIGRNIQFETKKTSEKKKIHNKMNVHEKSWTKRKNLR